MHLDVESLILLLRSDYATRLNFLAELKLEATWTMNSSPRPKLAGTKDFHGYRCTACRASKFHARSGVNLLGALLDLHTS